MCFLLSFKVQQAVSTPEFVHANWAHWLLIGLAVLHQQVAHANAATWHAWQPRATGAAWLTLEEMGKEIIQLSLCSHKCSDIPVKLLMNKT